MANGNFVPGTGTLKADTLPQAFAECALRVQTGERNAAVNAETLTANSAEIPNFVDIQANLETDTLTINITNFPISATLSSGNILIEAVDYLSPLTTLVPAVVGSLDVTDSQLTKATRVGALLELAQLLQEDEEAKGNLNPNRITTIFDLDNKTATISATLPINPITNDTTGAITLNVTNYLAA